MDQFTRREALLTAGLVTASLALPSISAAAPIFPRRARKRVLRLAHLTDIHVQPERRAGEGLAACLTHVMSLRDRPELILTGGDSVMDSFDADEPRTKLQWDLWQRVWKDHCTLPVRSCIGNHDVWGWNKKKAKTTGDEPLYGKKMAVEKLRLSQRYYSFDQAGWHFVVLDSTFPDGDGYLAKLDDEQMEWLKGDLAAVNPATPVLVLSHIPILSAAAIMYRDHAKDRREFRIPGGEMHTDAWLLKDLFLKHPNVKLCLSGHIHLLDRVEYNGVTYLCNGAVCGSWWKGKEQQCSEGYAVVDLFDDGTFTNEYVTYGWVADPDTK